MKFADTKVGDEVYFPRIIGCGYGEMKTFYELDTVERVTKTQFTVRGKRFRKAHGDVFGEGHSNVLKPGDLSGWGSKEEVSDQSKEAEEYIVYLKKKDKIYCLRRRVGNSSDCEDKDMDKVISLLEQALELLKQPGQIKY